MTGFLQRRIYFSTTAPFFITRPADGLARTFVTALPLDPTDALAADKGGSARLKNVHFATSDNARRTACDTVSIGDGRLRPYVLGVHCRCLVRTARSDWTRGAADSIAI